MPSLGDPPSVSLVASVNRCSALTGVSSSVSKLEASLSSAMGSA